MNKYVHSFRKEHANAKKNGETEEKEADPLVWALYRLICQWAINEGNMLLWTWTTLQWACMSRSNNIEALSLHNFTLGEDNIKVKYDKTKADQTGEKCTPKHLYANPFDPFVCVFLSLGLWFCLESASFEHTTSLFKRRGDEKEGNAAKRYWTALSCLLKRMMHIVKNFVRPGHANVHGLRKGSSIHVTSGTTCPPPVSSVANRGEWSMGKVLDVYWLFADAGDNYLGRCLAGLDPNNESFASLPPHWREESPTDNEFIKKGMHLMFACILQRYKNAVSIPLVFYSAALHLSSTTPIGLSVWLPRIQDTPSTKFRSSVILS
jgi:hypothetical protein